MWSPLNRTTLSILFLLCMAVLMPGVLGQPGPPAKGSPTSPYASWSLGPPTDPSFFPLAVWAQDPRDAKAYQAAGINLYVSLWKGPTKEQLNQLKLAGMPVICDQNDIGLRYKDEQIIIGWMHVDEPDNAQPLPLGVGYGFPIPPEEVQKRYQAMQEADPTRPVLVNLGQGVAWNGWWGRRHRNGHQEDYPEYVKGCDIACFDIYPVAHGHPAVTGNLWFVSEGVSRLVAAADPPKIVWNSIEAAGVNTGMRPTPHQIRAEVWMSIIHGSRGIVYFVHEFKPKFCTRVLLEDPVILEAVTRLNKEILDLAPVINSPEELAGFEVTSSSPEVPLATLGKRLGDKDYLFAVAMRDGGTTGRFKVQDPGQYHSVEVLGESRTLSLAEGSFIDHFQGYEVHLYRLMRR